MYEFKAVEEEILNYWENKRIYSKVKAKGKGKKKFYFLQGPPYTSGRLHMGQAWNHALKDMVLRYKRMRGFDVWDRAGYDMHGLPTEHKVQALLNLKTKEDIINFGLEKFSNECMKFSSTTAKQMDKDLWRFGTWLDYENAYWPITNDYIEGVWWLIKKTHEKKRLYEGLKTMTWCASCGTALAKHECEYKEVEEPSIFAKFPVKGKKNEYLIIWTTTPWTLAFNLAIMVNPELDYVKVQVDNEKWILAKGLAGAVMQAVFNKPLKILEEFKGEKLEGLEYIHPWSDDIKDFKELKKKYPKVHTVVLSSEYVTLAAGSGLVHCAPGCGPEDYEVGYRNDIPPYNTLNQYGIFEKGMGRFSGLRAKVDDQIFIDEMKKKGRLLAVVPVEHDYAHCQRCHEPVIFRATRQWFFRVEDMKDKMLETNKAIYWVPEAAKNAFNSWLNHLRDNSITKQRFWGTPVPVWVCDDCNKYVVVESAEELKKLGAKNIPKNLHKPWIDAVAIPCRCGGLMKRNPDILDVWIDAGVASWTCLYFPQKKEFFKRYFPADFIVEGKDQIRGWFNLLMVASMLAFEKTCFNAVHMHGFVTGVDGIKMSKSLGNILSPYELVDKHGADTMRYYLSGTPAGEDIAFSWEEAAQRHKLLMVLWNIHQYLIEYAKAEGINPAKLKLCRLGTEEEYILSKLNRTIKLVTELYDKYELDKVPKVLEELFLELSRVYIQLTREKISSKPELVLATIYHVMFDLLKMQSTLTPFISEKIYLNLKNAFGLKEASITLYSWPKADEKMVDEKLEERMEIAQNIVQAVLAAREKAQTGVRWPLPKATIITSNVEAKEAVEVLNDMIKIQTNVKHLEVKDELTGTKVELRPNKGTIGKAFKEKSGRITEALDSRIMEKIRKDGKAEVQGFGLTREHIIVKEELPENLTSAELKYGNVYIDTKLTPELEAEGYAREVVRRVQSLRKESGLKKRDKVELSIVSDFNLESWGKEIKAKVGATVLYFEDRGFKLYEEKIRGKNFKIGLKVKK